jgi:hypothetical protein
MFHRTIHPSASLQLVTCNRGKLPTDESGIVSNEFDSRDFRCMAAKYVDGFGREILWIHKSARVMCDNTHSLLGTFLAMQISRECRRRKKGCWAKSKGETEDDVEIHISLY